jgi:hypothetical protein
VEEGQQSKTVARRAWVAAAVTVRNRVSLVDLERRLRWDQRTVLVVDNWRIGFALVDHRTRTGG